jgi:hypothetical protein
MATVRTVHVDTDYMQAVDGYGDVLASAYSNRRGGWIVEWTDADGVRQSEAPRPITSAEARMTALARDRSARLDRLSVV